MRTILLKLKFRHRTPKRKVFEPNFKAIKYTGIKKIVKHSMNTHLDKMHSLVEMKHRMLESDLIYSFRNRFNYRENNNS